MSDLAQMYLAELVRAATGSAKNDWKINDLHRLTQYAERLAACEDAQSALLARGYGRPGMSFIEMVQDVPERPRRILDQIFAPRPRRPDELRYPPEEIARYFGVSIDGGN
jgi:hypothetical protein